MSTTYESKLPTKVADFFAYFGPSVDSLIDLFTSCAPIDEDTKTIDEYNNEIPKDIKVSNTLLKESSILDDRNDNQDDNTKVLRDLLLVQKQDDINSDTEHSDSNVNKNNQNVDETTMGNSTVGMTVKTTGTTATVTTTKTGETPTTSSSILQTKDASTTKDIPENLQRIKDLAETAGKEKRLLSSSTLTPSLLLRFPEEDDDDIIFPKDLIMFVYPRGFSINEMITSPECVTFILTEANGTRIYGTYLTFYIPLDRIVDHTVRVINITKKNKKITFDSNKIKKSFRCFIPYSISITSHWPFYEQFSEFLLQIYHIVLQSSGYYNINNPLYISTSVPHQKIDINMIQKLDIPIERIISNFITKVPLPPQGLITVQVDGIYNPIQFRRSPPNKLPNIYMNTSKIFQYLSLDNILKIFCAICVERKILFVSDYTERLTIVSEILISFLYPFKWQNVYIPILPTNLIDFICAPMTYICGIHSNYLPSDLMLDQIVVVYLDTNIITTNNLYIPQFPESRGILYKTLRRLVNVSTSPLSSSSLINFNTIGANQAFFTFFVRLMLNYKKYLDASDEHIIQRFDHQSFIKEKPTEYENFLKEFTSTQLFQVFIDERYEISDIQQSSSPRYFNILLFDESIDRFNGKPTPFQSDTSQVHKKIHIIKLLTNEYEINNDETIKWKYMTGFNLLQYFNTINNTIYYEKDISKILTLSSSKDISKILLNNEWPIDLNIKLFYPKLQFEPLVQPETFTIRSGGINNDIVSNTSLRFFADKRFYKHQFHTLRLKSLKQDDAFQNIINFFIEQQVYDEEVSTRLSNLSRIIVQQRLINTNTSIDISWKKLIYNLEEESKQVYSIIRESREKVFLPFIISVIEYQQRLRILFFEASKQEALTSQAKTFMEGTKKDYESAKYRYITLINRNERGRDGLFYTQSLQYLHRVIDEYSSMEDSIQALDQSEVTFQMILHDYNVRMPIIIQEICRINHQRITKFKILSKTIIKLKTKILKQQLMYMENLSKDIDLIDPDKDIKTFTIGGIFDLDFDYTKDLNNALQQVKDTVINESSANENSNTVDDDVSNDNDTSTTTIADKKNSNNYNITTTTTTDDTNTQYIPAIATHLLGTLNTMIEIEPKKNQDISSNNTIDKDNNTNSAISTGNIIRGVSHTYKLLLRADQEYIESSPFHEDPKVLGYSTIKSDNNILLSKGQENKDTDNIICTQDEVIRNNDNDIIQNIDKTYKWDRKNKQKDIDDYNDTKLQNINNQILNTKDDAITIYETSISSRSNIDEKSQNDIDLQSEKCITTTNATTTAIVNENNKIQEEVDNNKRIQTTNYNKTNYKLSNTLARLSTSTSTSTSRPITNTFSLFTNKRNSIIHNSECPYVPILDELYILSDIYKHKRSPCIKPSTEYPLHLSGREGFDYILSISSKIKDCVKNLSILFDLLGTSLETRSKKLLLVSKQATIVNSITYIQSLPSSLSLSILSPLQQFSSLMQMVFKIH